MEVSISRDDSLDYQLPTFKVSIAMHNSSMSVKKTVFFFKKVDFHISISHK